MKISSFRTLLLMSVLFFVSMFVWWSYFKLVSFEWLRFSDAAKFATIARNISEDGNYSSDFSFFTKNILSLNKDTYFPARGVPVAMPYAISLFFKYFGVSDLSVIATSGFFYILLVLAIFLLGKKLYGNLVGVLSALAVATNLNFLDYATSGASEVLYSFLAVMGMYFIFIKNKWSNLLFLLSLVLIYLTKPQGIVFIGVLILTWLLVNFRVKKALLIFVSALALLYILDRFVLYPLSFKYPVYPVVIRGVQAIFQYSPTTAVSDALRGQAANVVSIKEVVVKIFYNIYNFYKLLPDIASPYMWSLFFIGLFVWGKRKEENVYKFSVLLLTIGSFLLAAITIPFYRYLHPVIPFVYIVGVATLVWVIEKVFQERKFVVLASTSLVLLFVVLNTFGVIFLDSRFKGNVYNVGKPPVYVSLGKILKDNTNKDQVVVTNLDTWASWYGERKTVWFPLEPNQLVDSSTGKISFDAIYLTTYLIDDENYYMNSDWRQILENPNDSKKWTCKGCVEIKDEFVLKGVYMVDPDQNYEKQSARAVLLVRR